MNVLVALVAVSVMLSCIYLLLSQHEMAPRMNPLTNVVVFVMGLFAFGVLVWSII